MSSEGTGGHIMDALTIMAVVCALVMTVMGLADRFRTPAVPASSRLVDTSTVPVKNWSELVARGHRMGPPSAAVTILEFGDFECPACGALEHSLQHIRAEYPQSVAVVFRHWPLTYHRFAYPAARAAECAGAQGRFTPYHDMLYRLQDSLGLVSFRDIAQRAGISDVSAFQGCISESARVKTIDDDAAAALAAGGRFTPTLVINGQRLQSVPDSARLESIVQAAISSSAAHYGTSGP